MQNIISHNTTNKALLAFTAILGGALFAGCSNNSAPTQTAQTEGTPASTDSGATTDKPEVTEARIGYLANIIMPQPLVGLQDGQFEKLVPGVKFSGIDHGAGPEVMKDLRAGRVDIAYTGPYPPVRAFGKEKDVILLGGAGKGGTALMVAKGSPLKSIKDLKGKAIAINQESSTVDAMVRYQLIEAGLNPEKDVKIIAVEPAKQAAELQRGQIVAISAPAPWPSVAAEQNGAVPLLDDKQMLDNGNYWSGVYFTTKKFADANPNFIKQFVAANEKITADLNASSDKGLKQVVSAWEKVSGKKMKPAVAEAAWKTITFDTKATTKDYERAEDVLLKVGFIKKKTDLTGFIYGEK